MSYELIVGLDVGVVFGFELPPGNQHIDIKFDDIVLDEGVKFCGEILNELESAYAGNHLNPASLPQGSSDWPFVKLLNSQAYDRIADTYQERYFENPLLKTAFEAWLNLIPPGANVLDAGCGHGDPVIKRLLRKGFAVTGTDISPRMLDLARKNARRAKYLNLAIAEVTAEAEFSAVCSFSSMLYQDPIDFFTSIYRIHCALKPGGLLFLYAYDLHPSWRGLPYDKAINQWMWSWTYSKQEVKGALEEHGYFEVLDSQSVITPEEKELQIARWRENKQKEYEQLVEKYPDYAKAHPLDVSSPPDNLTYPYFVIARKRG
jgi:SAM-dependent methyltransferase